MVHDERLQALFTPITIGSGPFPTGVPVIAVGSVGLATEHRGGNIGEPVKPAPIDRLLNQFEAGEFDIAAIGRALLADPPG